MVSKGKVESFSHQINIQNQTKRKKTTTTTTVNNVVPLVGSVGGIGIRARPEEMINGAGHGGVG